MLHWVAQPYFLLLYCCSLSCILVLVPKQHIHRHPKPPLSAIQGFNKNLHSVILLVWYGCIVIIYRKVSTHIVCKNFMPRCSSNAIEHQPKSSNTQQHTQHNYPSKMVQSIVRKPSYNGY